MISRSDEKRGGEGRSKDLMRLWVDPSMEALSNCTAQREVMGTGDQRHRFLTQPCFYWLCDYRQVP